MFYLLTGILLARELIKFKIISSLNFDCRYEETEMDKYSTLTGTDEWKEKKNGDDKILQAEIQNTWKQF